MNFAKSLKQIAIEIRNAAILANVPADVYEISLRIICDGENLCSVEDRRRVLDWYSMEVKK